MPEKYIDREDLKDAVISLKTHIDDKFVSHQKYNEEVYNTINKTLDRHSSEIYGNGTHGLKTKMDRIHTSYKTVTKVFVGFSAFMTIVFAYLRFVG